MAKLDIDWAKKMKQKQFRVEQSTDTQTEITNPAQEESKSKTPLEKLLRLPAWMFKKVKEMAATQSKFAEASKAKKTSNQAETTPDKPKEEQETELKM